MLNALQLQSLATAELGNAVATYVLSKSGVSAVKALQDLATNLPLIPLGKVSPTELGTLTAELSKTHSAISGSAAAGETVAGVSSLQETASQLGSLISLVSQAEPTASGGLETPDQALAVQYLWNFSSGVLNGVQFWQGQQAAG